jgi:hypothetical protein
VRRRISIVVSTATAQVASAAACMTIGPEFPVEPVASLRIGKDTKTYVQRMFGDPWRTGLEDGHVTWTYARYHHSVFGETEARDLVIRFEAEGRVHFYTFNSTRPEDAGLGNRPAPF